MYVDLLNEWGITPKASTWPILWPSQYWDLKLDDVIMSGKIGERVAWENEERW